MVLKLYNTYSKKEEIFKPLRDKKVSIYNCGPTVYNYATIGNLRTFVFYDILRRSLEYLDYKVTQVMNITDVGHLTMTEAQKKTTELKEITDTEDGLDRMQKAATQEGLTVEEIAEKYTKSILGKNGDFEKLNIKTPHFLPKATDHIKEQIELIKILEKKGYAYKTKKAVYFNVQKFPLYEKLTGQKLEEMKKGERADDSDPERRHPADFRLWQLDQPNHPMQWNSPWGKGFPGWHIECSAMSKKYLDQPFDIHTGGEDHIKVHHPNEIAQSESAFDKKLANYWLHASFLTVDGKRMGKSLGNAYTLTDIESKVLFRNKQGNPVKGDPITLRYFFLKSHYRSKQDFTWELFKKARKEMGKIRNKMKEYAKYDKGKIIKSYKNEFTSALKDDLNTPKALASFWKLIKSDEDKGNKLVTILNFDKVLGLNLEKIIIKTTPKKLSSEEKKLIDEREKARQDKNWEKADEIRNKLVKLGIEIKDTEKGTTWNKI